MYPIGTKVKVVSGRHAGLTGVVRDHSHVGHDKAQVGRSNEHVVDFDSPVVDDKVPANSSGPYGFFEQEELSKL
jgi:hypothetical protein